MNCSQIEQIMPLFVGGDLARDEESAARMHLETCRGCQSKESDYRQTILMIADYGPPEFGDAVYVGIRRRVLAEIEADSTASVFTAISGRLRPHYRWASAFAFLLIAGFVAINFVRTREPEMFTAIPMVEDQPNVVTDAAPVPDNTLPVGSAKATTKVNKIRSHAADRRSRVVDGRRDRNVARREPVTPKKSPAPENVAANSTDYIDTMQPVLRVEMQTKDPNIRIIWFSKQPN